MNIDCNWCSIKTSEDNMYAIICLHTNSCEEEHTITEQFVMDFLTSNNITHGIDRIALSSFLEHSLYEQYICIAKGTMPEKGRDGFFDYKKELHDMKKKPLINEDGTVDYKNSLNLAVIKEGELLAEYIPATKGKDGYDIFGNILKSPGNGKDIPPLHGKGIKTDEAKRHYYAEYSGHIVMDGNNICIEKLYRLNGDLNIDTGNIIFDGDVEICGDVRSGMTIHASGDVIIHGHVGACRIVSGKTITISKGIQGRDDCEIYADQDIACKFIESCSIRAGNNIYADSVLNASVVAENQVFVTSKRGIVVSSEVHGMAGVTIKEAGNEVGMSTLLRTGLTREYYIKAANLQAKIDEIDSKIDAFNQHLARIITTDKEGKSNDLKLQIMRAKIVLDSERNSIDEELQLIRDKIATDESNSFITITGTVFSGVKIYMGSIPYLVTESVREVTFRIAGSQIECVPNSE